MTAILIANIGNRDVAVARPAPIPGAVHPAWNKDASRRGLGQALLENWEACRPHLSLPILGKAVRYAREQSGTLDGVVLVASDQSRSPDVAEAHLQQDTCELAPVVARLLIEGYGLPAGALTTWLVEHSPADYGRMREFFRQRLPLLRAAHPDATFYLELSGGTPAMTSMLLAAGAEVLGLAARPLYVSEREEQPFPLDLGRRLVADSLAGTIRASLEIDAYHAAARTVQDHAALLRAYLPAGLLLAVLEYARQRINFNFEPAAAALAGVAAGEWADEVAGLGAALQPDDPAWLLHEIVYNAEVKLRTGAYGDFLTRVFRFDEGALRHAASRLGAKFVDKAGEADADGEFLDPAWLAAEPEVDAYLHSENAQRDQYGRVRTTRLALNWVVGCLAGQHQDAEARRLRKRLGQIDKLSAVRNKSFAVHTFQGVSRQRIARALFESGAGGTGAEMEQVMALLREACALATGRPFDPANPYDAIQALCRDLTGQEG